VAGRGCAAGWKKFEPLWDFVIRVRRAGTMLPVLGVTSRRSAACKSGGFPWTIIPLERREDYMSALESTSVKQDVRPFAQFVGGLVEAGLRGQAAPPVPATPPQS
jgi:hypothetical protein